MKKTLLLFSLTLLSFASLNAQTVGDTFTEGGLDYTVTVVGPPNEVALTGPVDFTLGALVIPGTVSDGTNTFSVTSVGVDAFTGNGVITSVEFPDTVTTLANQAFRNNSVLATITFTTTNSITSIGSKTFENCGALTTIDNIISSVESIGGYCFFNNDLLASVTFPASLTTVGPGIIRASDGITSVDMSSCTAVTTMDDNVFQDLTSATSIILPPNLTAIGRDTFQGCSVLASINIPASVTSISYEAFENLPALKNVQVNSSTVIDILTPTNNNGLGTDVFMGTTDVSDATLYVPDTAAQNAYSVAAGWDTFGSIVIGALGTENIEQELGLSMYPNPTEGLVSIRNSKSLNADVTVYDLNGRSLMSKSISNTVNEINISNLASGIYLFKVKADNSEFVKRIVKQ